MDKVLCSAFDSAMSEWQHDTDWKNYKWLLGLLRDIKKILLKLPTTPEVVLAFPLSIFRVTISLGISTCPYFWNMGTWLPVWLAYIWNIELRWEFHFPLTYLITHYLLQNWKTCLALRTTGTLVRMDFSRKIWECSQQQRLGYVTLKSYVALPVETWFIF